MNIISEIYLAVNGGANLEDVIPLGADITAWEKLLKNYDPNRKPKPRRNRTGSHRSKRSAKARMDSVISWSTVELVSRVNGIDPDWKRGHSAGVEEELGLESPL